MWHPRRTFVAFVVLCLLSVVGLSLQEIGRLGPYWPVAQSAARLAHIDPRLVLAVMRVESNFKPDAVSRAGAIGLMQVMPETGAWLWRRLRRPEPFAAAKLTDPHQNAELGALYLAYLLKKAGGNLALALAAYNSGPANAERWAPRHWQGTVSFLRTVSFPETRLFIVKVLGTYLVYRLLTPFLGADAPNVVTRRMAPFDRRRGTSSCGEVRERREKVEASPIWW